MALHTMVSEVSGLPVLSVGGELDGSTTPELRRAIAAIREASVERVAVDVSGVDHIESTAIGLLIEANATFMVRGGRLAVVCTPGNVARILKISGLANVVPVFDSVESAVVFLSKR